VGAEPLRRRSSRWLLRRALGGRTIVTRDDASSAAIRDAGLDVETGADVVFGLDLDHLAPFDRGRADEIVVSVGGGVRPGLVSPASRRIEAAPIDEIAAAVDRLADATDAHVVLTRFRGGRDAAAAAQVRERLSVESEVLSADVDEHVRRVCGARLVVSSRYHPVVLAARAGVPTIVVSTQAKVRSLVAQIGHPSVQLSASWADVGRRPPPPAGARDGCVPEGVGRAHDALSQLVADAGAVRAQPSGG
jgi:polysaccharide pyruvyl transferase WcaK-like protein